MEGQRPSGIWLAQNIAFELDHDTEMASNFQSFRHGTAFCEANHGAGEVTGVGAPQLKH